MGFLSGIVHAIGNGIGDAENFFGGNNKKKQQNNQPQQSSNQNQLAVQNGQNNPQQQQLQVQRAQQNQQNISQQPQVPNNVNLALLNQNQNPNASTLIKANPQQPPTTTQTTSVAPAQHASILHDITHNPITNVVGGLAKNVAGSAINVGEDVSNTIGNAEVQAAKALGINAKTGVQTNQQQFGNSTLGIPTQADSAKNAALNTVQLAANVLAPGTVGLAERGITALAPDAASQLVKIGANSLAGGVVGGVGNTASAIQQGQPFGNVVKAGATGVGGGALIGGILPEVAGGLRKVTTSAADTAPAANEVASGVKSVNPKPAVAPVQPPSLHQPGEYLAPDVRGPNGEPVPQVSAESPNAQAPQVQGPPVLPESPPVEPVVPNAMHSTESQALDELNTKAKTAELSPTELTTRNALQAKQDSIDAHNAPPATAEVGKTTPPPEPTPQLQPESALPQDKLPKKTPELSTSQGPESPTALPVSQTSGVGEQKLSVEKPSLPSSVSQEKPNVNSDGAIAPNAPKVRANYAKQVEDQAATLGKKPTVHDVTTHAGLKDAADQWAASSSDEQLASEYTNEPTLTAPSDMAKADAALHRLAKAPASDVNNQAIDNIVTALEKEGSTSGGKLSFLKAIYGNLPKEAKIPILIRDIDKARLKAGLPAIKGDEAAEADIRTSLDRFLTNDENLVSQRDKIMGDADKSRAGITNNMSTEDAKALTAQGNQSVQDLKAVQNKIESNQGELAKFVSNISGKPKADLKSGSGVGALLTKAAGRVANLQKSLLLASVAGPINDSTLSTFNAATQFANMGAGSLLGKAGNLISRTPGKFISKMPSVKTFVKGSNLSKTAGEMRGKIYTGSAKQLLTAKGESGRSGLLQKADGGFLSGLDNRIHATREAATNLTAGIKNVQIQRMADQEAAKAGLTGEARKAYTALRTANPSTEMAAKGTKLTEETNNMNDNKFSQLLGSKGGGVGGALGKTPIVGPLLKNLFQPFSQWVGAQGYNAITDQNALANIAKIVKAGYKGDSQGVLDNVGKLGVNSAAAIGLGYGLSSTGHTSTTDAGGKGTDGLYLKFGNHYIPSTFLGPLAPSIIMGHSAHTAMQNHKGGSILEDAARIAGGIFSTDTAKTVAQAYLGGTPIGGSNNLIGPYGLVTQASSALKGPGKSGKQGSNWGDVGRTLTSDEANMFIPGAFSDANAGLNATKANPTHTDPQTLIKKLNPKTGNLVTDQTASARAQLESRIPGLSQTMPRDPTKSSKDFLSRVTRGNNSTPAQAAALNFQTSPSNPAFVRAQTLAQQKLDKVSFLSSGKQQATINGMVYQKDVNGNAKAMKQSDYNFLTKSGGITPAQRGIDQEAFKNSGKQQQTIHGVVWQKADDGKVTGMEQKDYDYKQADSGMTEAKNSGDYTGYQQHSGDLLKNISDQLQNPNLSESQINTLTAKAMAVQHSSAEYDSYQGFTKPPKADAFKGLGQINNAKPGYVQQIQHNAAKYNLDGNALMAVSAMEGLGGGVGDNGHAFGPFQMNDAGGVLTGKYKSGSEAQAYAESPAGIEDAIKQISKVAGGLKGQAAINAIVNGFERPADPGKEIQGALDIYGGGKADLSAGGGTSVTEPLSSSKSASASKAADLIKSNTISGTPNLGATSFGKLAPSKVTTSVPILQKIIPSDLVKKRTISVATVHA